MRITVNQAINQFNVTTNQELYQYRITVAAVGTSGLSAYSIALVNGFFGTEQEWLESLKGQDATTNTWIYYVSTWDTPPEFVENIIGGSVYRYIKSGIVRYRFVPSPYLPSQDAFYSIYNRPNLSGLIVSR